MVNLGNHAIHFHRRPRPHLVVSLPLFTSQLHVEEIGNIWLQLVGLQQYSLLLRHLEGHELYAKTIELNVV